MAVFVVFAKLPAGAMAVFPFIFLKNKTYKDNKILLNHELIHFRQQLELLIIPFYLLYFLNYLVNLMKYKSSHEAYVNIVFEREAYVNETDLDYLKSRKKFAWYK